MWRHPRRRLRLLRGRRPTPAAMAKVATAGQATAKAATAAERAMAAVRDAEAEAAAAAEVDTVGCGEHDGHCALLRALVLRGASSQIRTESESMLACLLACMQAYLLPPRGASSQIRAESQRRPLTVPC
mmetsp:Transcript_37298/g.116112  ORF Transcript_37298/g.116112 Transcript_37298/m.116112 type:complete len:129 (-) Transcript_37298:185-571(-)